MFANGTEGYEYSFRGSRETKQSRVRLVNADNRYNEHTALELLRVVCSDCISMHTESTVDRQTARQAGRHRHTEETLSVRKNSPEDPEPTT